MQESTLIVFDLEFVQPNLQVKSGLIDKYGQFQEEKYQIYSSRIWQMAFVAKAGEFFQYVHPGIDPQDLSVASGKFLKLADRLKLGQIDPGENLAHVWTSLMEWLKFVAGPSRHIILVAQQAQHNDEIVLSVEMARHDLAWPEGYTVEAVDALPYIQQSITEQSLERERSWTVSAIYKEFTGFPNSNMHNALADAKCLLANIKTCWGLKIMSNLGFQCPYGNIFKLSSSVESNMSWLFWDTVHKIFNFDAKPLRDNRQSIWSLSVQSKRGNPPWPREVIKSLERDCEIYTVSDLVERDKLESFRQSLTTHPTLRGHQDAILEELDLRHTQLLQRNKQTSKIEMGFSNEVHTNKQEKN